MAKRKLWTGIFAFIGMLVLILDGKTALEGAALGIDLCVRTVIPSLFPFFVLSGLLTGALTGSSLQILRPLGRLCGVPKGAEALLVAGFLGGYPVGARSVADAYRGGQLSRKDAQRMLAFCNNAGPSFLFGMVAAMFPQKWMAWALWGVHITGAVLTAQLFSGSSENQIILEQNKTPTVSDALYQAVTVMGTVCGWVVLFRVLIAFFDRWFLWLLPGAARVAVVGMLELSNGCCTLLNIHDVSLRFVICSGMLAFGGLCVTMQTASVTMGLSLRYYLAGKAVQTLISVVLSSAIAAGHWFPAGLMLLILTILTVKRQKKCSIPRMVGV